MLSISSEQETGILRNTCGIPALLKACRLTEMKRVSLCTKPYTNRRCGSREEHINAHNHICKKEHEYLNEKDSNICFKRPDKFAQFLEYGRSECEEV